MRIPFFLMLSGLFLLTACLDRNEGMDYDNTADIAYLEENAAREDVIVTESGLQYRILEEGNSEGESPSSQSDVRVHYTGTFIDGTEFDSSHARGEPSDFNLQGVILGFNEGIQLMQTGAVYEFVIPAQLAYGNNPPFQSNIYPGATLIFVVELLEVL